MNDPSLLVATASIGMFAVALSASAGLKAWHGWLDLRRARLAGGGPLRRPSTATRVEIARLRDRVRRLEAIASGAEG